jgi:phosphatidylserine/phosphatidylglycerophosphate/cardiolipin synthase-like enzyme
MSNSLLSLLAHISAALFLPFRRLFGPLHRRRSTLSDERLREEEDRGRLEPPWGDDPRWYAADFPPHAHNAVLPLVHGDEYFPALIRELQSARERVTIAGWTLTPLMALERDANEYRSTVVDLLRDASSRAEVYVLLWEGAPALFEPNIHFTRAVQRVVQEYAPRVRCVLDNRASFSHDHHQKAVTIDGRVAFVGGMDLSTFQGDRWDTGAHPLRFGPNWHDVQMRLQGEVVADVERNFCQRWNAVTGESLQPCATPELDRGWNTPAQVVRTVPEGFYPFAPEGHYGIRHSILAAIEKAERYIYLENQYLWAPEVVQALCEAMGRNAGKQFRIILVLPAKAYTGRYDNDHHVQELRDADAGRGIFEAYTPYAAGAAIGRTGYAYMPIYVHAKVGIIDDEWFSIGSANLNQRGLATDTEMNVQVVDGELARSLRIKLWAEHLGMTEEEVAARDPIDVIDGPWKQIAAGMEKAVSMRGSPPQGQIHQYVVGRKPTNVVLDFVQDLTLEH